MHRARNDAGTEAPRDFHLEAHLRVHSKICFYILSKMVNHFQRLICGRGSRIPFETLESRRHQLRDRMLIGTIIDRFSMALTLKVGGWLRHSFFSSVKEGAV